jgi:hypothetical protein
VGRLIVLGLTALFTLGAQTYTRGVGIYPGDPRQNFAADLVPETQTYRNLALHRPAYQFSAYDYNLTAQLITDGIKNAHLPRWVSVATSDQGVLSKQDREHVLDHNSTSTVNLNGARRWLQLKLLGGDGPLELDSRNWRDCVCPPMLAVIGGGIAGAYPLFLPHLVRAMNAPYEGYATPLRRLAPLAFRIDDPAERDAFLRGEVRGIEVPGSDRRILYDPMRRTAVGISRLGTSEAVAVGAYAFALRQLDRR